MKKVIEIFEHLKTYVREKKFSGEDSISYVCLDTLCLLNLSSSQFILIFEVLEYLNLITIQIESHT